MIRRKTDLLFFGIVGIAGSVALAACGGAGEAKAPAKMSEPESSSREPTSVAEAQEQIERARADLSRDAKQAEGDKLDKDSASSAPPPSPGGGSTSTAKPTGPREESTRAAPADTCSQSCRALSSMRRAVSALCRMTGDEDARCSEAKKTLGESESRVARCHCST